MTNIAGRHAPRLVAILAQMIGGGELAPARVHVNQFTHIPLGNTGRLGLV